MKYDITRDTFCKSKHYRMVNMQQGRVQVDADWNEQNNIQFHYEKEYLKDLIGKTGTLAKDNGFAISLSGSEFQIAKGHYYVDGILCENEKPVEYSKQDDVLQQSTFVDPSYLVYLDVWERHITHLDDPYIREQALGNVDTATRTKIVWQVLTINASGLDGDKCKIWENALQNIDKHTTGTVEARAKPSTESQDRCSLYETAGYTRLENQLYRIEVHDSGTLATATLKYSRENGSVVSRITKYESENRLIIAKRGKDEQLDFKIDDWVEITDDFNELHAVPGTLAKLTKVDDMTIEYSTIVLGDKIIGEENYPLSRNPKIRRWESIKNSTNPLINSATPRDSDGYVELEDGVQVRLGNGFYRSGDYWIVPARTRQGKVEWPTDTNGKPVALGPAGIAHHYAPLALLDYNKSKKKFYEKGDLRSFFSSLTELVGIHYAGGDGQQALPDNKLPAPLSVSVTLGDRPISNTPMSGVTVKFTIVKESKSTRGSLRALPDGQPKQHTTVNVPVSAEGVAECEWILGDNMQDQQVKAELYDECASKVDVPPVYFHASLPISFYYIEGDGIEGTEEETVHLRAGVALGTQPLSANYRVSFTMLEGADTLSSREEAPSAKGIVHVTMTISGQKQQVMAKLLYSGSDSDPFLPANLPPVYFNVALQARSNANTGIAVLKLPTEFNRPLIFGPFEHKLTKLSVPPSVYLGIPLLGGKDKEAVIFMEDFPGSYILFKPIIVTTTQFYILIAKNTVKDVTGSFAELVKLLQSTVKRRRRPDSAALEAIMTSDIAVAARAFRPIDISTITALTAQPSTIPPAAPLAFPEGLMIRWWAVPSEHTGEQSSGPINLEGKLPTISFDKVAYSLSQNVTVIAVNPIPPSHGSDMRRTIQVILTAGQIPEENLTAGQIPKGVVLKLEETEANSSVFQKEFVLADITAEGVVIKIDDRTQTIPGLKIGEQFNVVWKYKQKKTVLDTAVLQ